MFSKDQRQALGRLCKELYGAETKWQKLLNAPEFQVVTEEVEDDGQQYVQLQRIKNGRPMAGTVLKVETALERGVVTPEEVASKRKIVKSRAPTFEELLTNLRRIASAQRIALMNPEEKTQVLAHRMVNNLLDFSVKLSKKKDDEEYATNLNNMLNTLPEDKRKVLTDLVIEEGADAGESIVLDAFQFVSDYVYATNNKTDSEELYLSAYSKAALLGIDINSRRPNISVGAFFKQQKAVRKAKMNKTNHQGGGQQRARVSGKSGD